MSSSSTARSILREAATVDRVEALREYLKEEFGIKSVEEFEEAYKKCPRIDISPFAGPVKRACRMPVEKGA